MVSHYERVQRLVDNALVIAVGLGDLQTYRWLCETKYVGTVAPVLRMCPVSGHYGIMEYLLDGMMTQYIQEFLTWHLDEFSWSPFKIVNHAAQFEWCPLWKPSRLPCQYERKRLRSMLRCLKDAETTFRHCSMVVNVDYESWGEDHSKLNVPTLPFRKYLASLFTITMALAIVLKM
jgi:hypothetical protein